MGTSATPIGRDESVAGEQRQSKRKVVSEAVAIELPPGMEARLRDVSESGLSISSGSPLELGTTTSFRFELPDATAVIDAEGVVVWSDDSGRSVITCPPDGRAGRTEMSHRAPRCGKLTDVLRGSPRWNGRLKAPYPCRQTWW